MRLLRIPEAWSLLRAEFFRFGDDLDELLLGGLQMRSDVNERWNIRKIC